MDFDVDSATEVLSRTPGTLKALLSGLSEPWVRGREGPETFSAFDVVGHLIDGEETDWIPRARIILARGDDPRFEPYDRFRHRARNEGRSLESLLDEFATLRDEEPRAPEILESLARRPRPARPRTPGSGCVTLRGAPRGVGRPRPRARRAGRRA